MAAPSNQHGQQVVPAYYDTDDKTQMAISVARPLPITGTLTPSGTQDTNLKQVNGTTTTSGAGAVTAGTQRTTLASDDPAVASLSVMDDWDEANRAAVNTIAGQVGVQGGAGASTALTQRVALATDANVVDTELPAAAALADATANPTTPSVGAFLVGYNGTTWDRLRSDTTNGLDVDVTRVGGTVTTKETRSASSAVTSVAAAAVDTTVLASNANRLGATVYNDTDKDLFLKLGSSASTTSFTARLAKKDANGIGGYYEVPFGYTGAINGIWDTAPTGSARVTELT